MTQDAEVSEAQTREEGRTGRSNRKVGTGSDCTAFLKMESF